MSDVALGLSTGTFDDIAGRIYQEQYPRYFSGTTTFSDGDVDYRLDWDVVRAPAFDLTSEVDHGGLARAVVRDGEVEGISRDDLLRGVADTYDGRTFHVDLPEVELTLTVDGTPAHDTASVRIAATVDESGPNLVATPLSATVSTGQRFPDWVYNQKVVPIALEAGRQLLAGIPVPIPSVEGVSLTQPVVQVADNHLVVSANIAGNPAPDRQFSGWPPAPFFIVLGPDAVGAVTSTATDALDGLTDRPHDSTDILLGTAYYKATVTLSDVRSDGWVADDRTISVAASVSGSGSAGIDWIVGGSVDGFFDLTLSPDPVATVRLDLDDAVLSARTVDVGGFDLDITPTSGDIVSMVLSWVVDALSGVISPYVADALTGISFDVYRVPTLHVDLDEVSFDATPVALGLSVDDGTVTVGGYLDITDR
ncbi:hypothetical protein [Saccharothrix texasensis]|uniref:Uncharacterized protein n=1 Tax=Saccharothrix texasensis TaxID=103734 RepID=A0A3N1GX67_9PSEU|nr:hypothetical protein [Saccharothrix texasensis]ROP34844.1 hypothetical protein EDD40_0048 [Saccharothrix texasensis]